MRLLGRPATLRGVVSHALSLLVILNLLPDDSSADDTESAPDGLSQELRTQIETQLGWEPRLLPQDDDAGPLLIEATRKRQPIDDRQLEERLWLALDGRSPWLEGDDLATCRGLVNQNTDAFGLLTQAAASPGISDCKHAELNASALRELFTLARFDAHELASRGEWDGAIERMHVFLRVGALLRQNPIEFGNRMSGFFLARASAETLARIAGRFNAPVEKMTAMRERIESSMPAVAEEQYSLRQDFHQMRLPVLDRLPDNNDLQRAVEAMISLGRPKRPIPFPTDANAELDAREAGILKLLHGHPVPFDKGATVGLTVECYLEALQYIESPGELRRNALRRQLENKAAAWPPELSLHPDEMVALLLGHKQPEVPADVLERCRRQLRDVRNPLGRHFVSSLLPDQEFRVFANSCTHMTAAGARLAICAYRQKTGALPPDLAALINSGVIERLPRDPYGDVLRYSMERRLLWSVGPNGVDDGGRNNIDRSQLREMLRKVRPAGAEGPSNDEYEADVMYDDLVFDLALPPRE
jgi:hypothetical protein